MIKKNDIINDFGKEWGFFKQGNKKELRKVFNQYFHIFPWELITSKSEGFDMGCGSGRWAKLVAPKIGKLNCIDPSSAALEIAKNRLANFSNIIFLNFGVSDVPLNPNSQDFGYSLGVLHHVPNTAAALSDCVKILKPGAPFLIYLYYRFDNRPKWYASIWLASDYIRRIISNLPPWTKSILTNIIATIVYFPLARLSLLAEKLGIDTKNWILSSYRRTSFYTMRTDSRDRFGTPLEKRFTRSEIMKMMQTAGLENIHFSNRSPFWCAVGTKRF